MLPEEVKKPVAKIMSARSLLYDDDYFTTKFHLGHSNDLIVVELEIPNSDNSFKTIYLWEVIDQPLSRKLIEIKDAEFTVYLDVP